jgi:hypothetical protein
MNGIPSPRATVRTYRHGLGDCHLVTLHGSNSTKYRILIDCGVILGTSDAPAMMDRILKDVIQDSGGSIDLLVATHEHWDHLSGFVQAKQSFDALNTSEVWLSWIENPDDAQARRIKDEHGAALALVRAAALQMDRDPAASDHPLNTLASFFGVAGRMTSAQALDAVRKKVSKPKYVAPADAPIHLASVDATLYVLGPPRDMKLLRKTLPSKEAPEAFPLAGASIGLGEDAAIPFINSWRIPTDIAHQQAFFDTQYWNGGDWRRIDSDYLGGATELAIALDNMTNNTSLVIAIELGEGDVLLFAADAQVGNWLSWSSCNWTVGNRSVSGDDLLDRTIFYKVGHHGSPNATLLQKGLGLMRNLKFAVVPVNHDMAVEKGWGRLPLQALMEALQVATAQRGCVLRTDVTPDAANLPGKVTVDPLYFDIQV